VIKSAKQNLAGKKLLVDISNGRRAGGGFHIAPEAKANDGLFDIIIADALSPFQRLLYLPVIEKGKHMNLSFIQHFRTKKICIESDQPIQYHLDGEYGEAQKLEIVILPDALNFRY
jgi:diacylglycerol kinase (ATP)